MNTKSRKAKGRRLQQKVVELILNHYPQLQKDDVQSRSMGASGEDIILSPFARSLVPFSIECKNQEKLNVVSAFNQAKTNSEGHIPLLVHSKNRGDTLATLRLEDLLRLVSGFSEEEYQEFREMIKTCY